jgi:hypothetical protein
LASGIDGESLAADQTDLNARSNHALKHATEDLALTEALIAGAGERRVVWYGIFQAQLAKPPIGQINLNLAADLPLRSDGENVPDDQHPDHQHRIDRRSPNLRVIGREFRVDPGQV